MENEIQIYNDQLSPLDKVIADYLATELNQLLQEATSRIWHGHPVWFLKQNPIAGYSKQKSGMRLMFWSGADFEEEKLAVKGGKFKDASVFFKDISEIEQESLRRWIKKSIEIQWDYKNIVKRKGQLIRISS